MKKFIVVLILALFVCSCNRQTSIKETTPYSVFADNNKILLGGIGDTQVAVFISSSSSASISGYSYIINGNDNDTVAFRLKTKNSKLIFEQNGIIKKIKIKDIKTDDDEISGVIKTGLFSVKTFSFKPHKMPEYQEFDSRRYNNALFDVNIIKDVKYGNAKGYWTTSGYDYDIYDVLRGQGRTLSPHSLDLLMDIYLPKADTLKKRPLVMFIHGGAFYVGCKDDLPMRKWCSHYASLGYVAVSIDYRMGFRPSKRSIERAGYAAIQDAHAAMRYLVENQSVYGIDTSMMFVGGTSAGAITALHLAFMTNETRPETSYEGLWSKDMGDIDHSGNLIDKSFTIKGVVDMWGAVYNIDIIDSKKIPVVAFHGNLDDIVPYGYDYPFSMFGSGCKFLFNKMYGSSTIIDRLLKNGVDKSKLYTLHNKPHSPHVDSDKGLNHVFYYIQDRMDPFFYDITANAEIIADGNYYSINNTNATDVTWLVEGGFVLTNSGNSIKVAWFNNAPEHIVHAAGKVRGTGFVSVK